MIDDAERARRAAMLEVGVQGYLLKSARRDQSIQFRRDVVPCLPLICALVAGASFLSGPMIYSIDRSDSALIISILGMFLICPIALLLGVIAGICCVVKLGPRLPSVIGLALCILGLAAIGTLVVISG